MLDAAERNEDDLQRRVCVCGSGGREPPPTRYKACRKMTKEKVTNPIFIFEITISVLGQFLILS